MTTLYIYINFLCNNKSTNNSFKTNKCVLEWVEAVAVLVWMVLSYLDKGIPAIHSLGRGQIFAHAIGSRHEWTLSQTLLQLFGIYLQIKGYVWILLCTWQIRKIYDIENTFSRMKRSKFMLMRTVNFPV